MDNDDLEEITEHFTHCHPLKLMQMEGFFYSYSCYCCGLSFEAPTVIYECREGECRARKVVHGYSIVKGVFLCVLCAGVEETLESHALHPLHPRLELLDNRLLFGNNVNTNLYCDACCGGIHSECYSYHCDVEKCYFVLHVKCAHSLKPSSLALPRDSPLSPHSHLLILLTSCWADFSLKCESCDHDHDHAKILRSSAFDYFPLARCVPCNLNYHIYCKNPEYRVPECIMYLQGHHQHPLFLSREKASTYSSCDVCCKKRDWPDDHGYACLECKSFTAHVSCVFQSLTCLSSNSVNKAAGDMMLKSGPLHEAAQCQRCKNRILDDESPVYGCQYCNFFLHESCISPWLQEPMLEDEEEEKTILSQPYYSSLVLVFAHGKVFKCASCERRCSGFMFKDKRMEKFVVDLECIFVLPSLELIGHDHPVILLQNRDTKKSHLRCVRCCKSFGTLASCRLPRTILHECHFHPLTLVPCFVEYSSVEQCYCDVCEEKRDPEECIYYCDECRFEVHIGCVESEVVGPSRGKLKDVEFVTLEEIKNMEKAEKNKRKVRDVFSLKEELQHSYTNVHNEFDIIFRMAKEITWENSFGENLSHNNVLNLTLYSSDPFKNFVKELTSVFPIEITHSTLESLRNEEVVRVREYLVPLSSEEVVEALFDKYGDFGSSCACSREAKQYLFVGLCKALQSMHETKIARVTESLLMEWWAWLAMGKAAGFKIQFALEGFKRVVYAHFGLEADKYAIDELTSVREEIRELPVKTEELTRKMEELAIELNETRRKLEGAVKKEKELREEVFRVRKSPLMTKCLQEAHDLACNTAGETFLPPSD